MRVGPAPSRRAPPPEATGSSPTGPRSPSASRNDARRSAPVRSHGRREAFLLRGRPRIGTLRADLALLAVSRRCETSSLPPPVVPTWRWYQERVYRLRERVSLCWACFPLF